ncbi:MAG TPA: polysaccharide pyruvyl transferase family protein, partial [Candidatus Angelobacter sp.]|nr:polysaccharide pyruvyl transferase family protein [Candidatus Angelobacter sp.]
MRCLDYTIGPSRLLTPVLSSTKMDVNGPAIAVCDIRSDSDSGSSLRTKALLFGYYGSRNLGDELMLYCLRGWLEAQGVEISVLAEDPAEVERVHQLPAIPRVPLLGEWAIYESWVRGAGWNLLSRLREFDMLIHGGGECIRDDCGPGQFWYSVECLVAALLMGKQVCLLNVGLGRLRVDHARRVLSWILRRSAKTVVRDQRSVEVCHALGAANVHYAPDIVSLLPGLLGFYPSLAASGEGCRYVLVCLRDRANFYGRYAMTDERLSTLAGGLDALVEGRGLRVKFLPFQDCPSGVNDNRVHDEVFRRMQHREAAEVLEWSDDFYALGKTFAGAQAVIAMRLHAAILAKAFLKPCAIMPYDQKLLE